MSSLSFYLYKNGIFLSIFYLLKKYLILYFLSVQNLSIFQNFFSSSVLLILRWKGIRTETGSAI